MGHQQNKNRIIFAALILFATVLWAPLKSVPVPNPTYHKQLSSSSRITLVSSSSNDDSTFSSPEVDSLFLVIAITVLGLTSVIGYYIITNRKGPH